MTSSCAIDDGDTNFKKRKSGENEEICKSHKGVKVVDLQHCRKHTVVVTCRFADAHSSSDEDLKSAFSSLLKEAGCQELQMCSHGAFCFFAYLTEEQAKKLSGVNHVKQVMPCVRFYCPGSIPVRR